MRVAVLGLMLAAAAPTASAQMFSVPSARSGITMPSLRLSAGIEATQWGFSSVPSKADIFIQYEFSSPLLRLEASLESVKLHGTFGRKLGSLAIDYTEIGVEMGDGIPVFARGNWVVTVPFRLNTVYTLVRNSVTENTAREFNQNAVAGGTGIGISGRMGTRVRFEAEALARYGYSSNGFNGTGGATRMLEATGRLHVDRLLGPAGLSVGAGYRWRDYLLDTESLNHSHRGTHLTVGLTF